MQKLPFVLALSLFIACGESDEEPDSGVPDQGVQDTGTRDLGAADSGARDSGPTDAAGEDVRDASGADVEAADAPALDAEPVDSGVDFCDPNPCFAGVACTNGPTTFTCGDCPVGLIGDGVVCEEHDECDPNPCLAGTDCTDILAPGTGFTCSLCQGASCPILRAQAGPDQRVIAGTVTTLQGSATGFNGAFSCAWENDQDAVVLSTCTATVSVSTETVYTLTVTDASGQSATDQLVVRMAEFLADAGPHSNIELGDIATLSGSWSGASCGDQSCIACEWRLSDATLIAQTCTATVSPAATTQYFLTVTDTGAARSAVDSTTVFVTDQPAQLCGWDVVVMTSSEYPTAANPNYTCDATGTARRQTVNSRPAIVLSDLVVENARIVGHISVETTADDDPIGFIWGWENPKHHYLLTWKKVAQNWTAGCGNAPRGIAVKKIDGAVSGPDTISFNAGFGYNATDYVYSCADGWSLDRANAGLLRDDTVFLVAPGDVGAYTGGWVSFTTYRFEFYYTPTKTKILIYADDAMTGSTADLITTLLVEDASYPAGAFGFYSNSQEQVQFGDFTLASLLEFRADAGAAQTIELGATATLSGSASLAVPPYVCTWTDASNAVVGNDCETQVSPGVSTTYSLTVTDDFGRSSTDSVTVTVTSP